MRHDPLGVSTASGKLAASSAWSLIVVETERNAIHDTELEIEPFTRVSTVSFLPTAVYEKCAHTDFVNVRASYDQIHVGSDECGEFLRKNTKLGMGGMVFPAG